MYAPFLVKKNYPPNVAVYGTAKIIALTIKSIAGEEGGRGTQRWSLLRE